MGWNGCGNTGILTRSPTTGYHRKPGEVRQVRALTTASATKTAHHDKKESSHWLREQYDGGTHLEGRTPLTLVCGKSFGVANNAGTWFLMFGAFWIGTPS